MFIQIMAASVNGDPSHCENNSFPLKIENCDSVKSHQNNCSESHDDFIETWGFNVKELYALATTFLKEKEGKAFHISYKDKLVLVACSQQVLHGKFVEEKSPPVGYLDVIGRDRRQAWQALGDMLETEAKGKFISLLHDVCPLFRPFVLAHKCDLEEKERRRIAEELEKQREEEERRREEEEEEQIRLEEERIALEEEAHLREEREKQRQGHQKRLIQEALNKQTFHQFKAYAEQQCPGNPEQQAILIRQLQEQHYQQYMQQVLQEQLASKPPQIPITNHAPNITSDILQNRVETKEGITESSADVSDEEIFDPLPLSPASMWTRKDILEFKEAIRKEGGDGIIKVGHGETVTVRVPTHEDGNCLFWEFATDSFDLGFGVYFEWTTNPDAQVTVHISESEDEEEEDDDMEQAMGDIEKGPLLDKAPLSVIIPVYRRDCHEEVYAGNHHYPGQGVYLLKFDNSYSLWRSKTLYYRVYYTR